VQTFSELSHRHFVRLPLHADSPKLNRLPCNGPSRSDQPQSPSHAQVRRLNSWRNAIHTLLSCCLLFGLFGLFGQGVSAQTITYVQDNYATPQTPQTAVEVAFNAAQVAGDLNVVAVGWNDSTTVVSAVTDSAGNVYALAVGPTVHSGFASQSIYYAKNISSAAAGTNTVTVTFSGATWSADVRILEYSGADPSNPVDVTAAKFGTSATAGSGLAITTNATDLVFGANLVQTWTTGPGNGFKKRMITVPDGDIAEDKMVTAAGSYNATAPLGSSGPWIMQLVAFRTPSGSGGAPPITPTALSCDSASMTGPGTDACTVTLSAAAPSGGFSVSLSSSNSVVTVPTTLTVPANATSATFTATVSSVGTAQTATLKASAGGGSNTFALQLNANTPTLTVATSSSPSTYGGAVTFTATISSGPSGSVTFYDGGAVIATAVINGTTATVTTSSLIVGSQTITASWPGNANYGAVTSSAITQTVNKATPAIIWIAPVAIAYGTALSSTQLDASSTVAGTFSYSPAAGTVLTAGSHAITVIFTPTVSTDYATATSSVAITVNAATPAITWAAPAAILYGTALSVTQLDASSTVAGTFAYTPAAGTVLKAGSQALSVTFTPTDTTDYTTATATVTLTVNGNLTTPAITWAIPAAITYGTALNSIQLDASSTVAGTFAYIPAAGTVLKAGSQALSVTLTPTDTTDYTTATATVGLTVNTATPTIKWAAPAAILYGTALSATQLNASSIVAGTFAYIPAAGTVLKAGAETLSVTFTPADTTDYSTVTATVPLTVSQVAPAISWATPSAIPYGTALSGTQLDASSTTPGTFVYSPAAGAVLAVGSQTLSVTFTPTDATDYTTATQTVTLTVSQNTPTLSINATSVAFGDVTLNTPATQAVTLSSTGTAAVTVDSAVVTGTGFTMSAATIPVTLTPGQLITLSVEFDPTAAGAATGQLTVTSTSSTNGTAVIALTGTGTATSYAVDLSWTAPTTSTDPVVGYNVYRALSGSSTYQLLNSSVDTQTTYADSTVQDGEVYDYIVESVDDNGVESVPTSPVAVTIP
jgi:hypothetical protein